MSQSCETLITKINEWQKAILELEKLSNEFLNTGDEKIKTEIDTTKQEIKKLAEEYQELAYPELPNGEKLFWPEKEMLDEIIQKTGLDNNGVEVRNNHIVRINLSSIDLSQFSIDFSFFHNLEEFSAQSCKLKKLPPLPTTIKRIWIYNNRGIEIPDDLTNLNNLEEFNAPSCKLKKLPPLPTTIKKIWIYNNRGIEIPDDLTNLNNLEEFSAQSCELKKLPHLPSSIRKIWITNNLDISEKEKEKIREEYPNAIINF